ncbi:MAG TPA: SusD/RagB family nutrient-binding outer membrane lipoprotein [Chitinophaga sp.]|uniref:SusD/RagB family nutrient-binding outer membrane lipoprotein n=1 Tax=Chitinophaga sp. TaxID=1869181 RepID=UPI002BDC83E2|nr:SusD/RagB family nutrient-binding outer membrane lipoprotein [Chitinophaga sp.]HVI46103.1 SusD/RagB family nutrient-binding outer membrane lipoprotein [Chitinophaga sp.]
MKYNRKYLFAAVSGVMLLASSCTKSFEDLNTSPVGVTDEQANADYGLVAGQLSQAQRAIMYGPNDEWIYQLQQNLNGDIYSGYMSSPTPFRGNSNNITYDLVDGWNEWVMNPSYTNVMNPLYRAENYAKQKGDQFKDVVALCKVIRVEAMHRVSDVFGPIVYTKYNVANAEGGVDYDSQQDVYSAFFKDLDEAVALLKTLTTASPSIVMKKGDLAYAGDYKKWLKFANTLRLRLALRISKVDAAKAKAEGEKALDPANGGVISDNSESFLIDLVVRNSINTINNDWHDINMGAPMESIMGGYNDPRLPKYFVPATDAAVTGQFKGIRQGINIDAKSRYENYSRLVTFPAKVQLLSAAEAWFLKAEAALKGWANAGDVQTNYEAGIDHSFQQYGLDAATYKNDAVSLPKPYIDPNR